MVEVTQSDELDGLGAIVADLLTDNLAADPSLEKLLQGRQWAALVSVPEAESQFHIIIGNGAVSVDVTAPTEPALRITTDGDTLIALPEVPLIAGLPSPLTASGRELIAKLLKGDLKIGGLLQHPVKVTKALRLLNTAQSA